MYQNLKHKKAVENRGDGYKCIGSYKMKEITIDGKNKRNNAMFIRVKCPYCGKEYDVNYNSFVGKCKTRCIHCYNSYINSFAYYIEVELGENLDNYLNQYGRNDGDDLNTLKE